MRKKKFWKKSGRSRTIGTVLGGVALLSMLASCATGNFGSTDTTLVAPQETAQVEPIEGDEAIVIAITDGDTIETDLGVVRLIGIDTPELGQCGFEESSARLAVLIPVASTVTLVLPEGQNDRDKHDRLLRYVHAKNGLDAGTIQLVSGYAVARYDSRDGYPEHPREAEYQAAQKASFSAEGVVVTPKCAAQAEQAAAEQAEAERVAAEQAAAAQLAAEQAASSAESWWTQYPSCSQLKKNGNGHPTGPFNVNDPAEVDIYNHFQYGTSYRGDGDGDGWACE